MPSYDVEVLNILDPRNIAETKRVDHNFDKMANYIAYKKIVTLMQTLKYFYKNSLKINLL